MKRKAQLTAGAVVAVMAAGLLACVPQPTEPTGRALYAQFCTGCHGTGGNGDGPLAASLKKRPADLTHISARNGGKFPLVRVMSTIDGYTRRNDGKTIMPELGPMLSGGPVAMVDTGKGVLTPTPARLVALADYLRTIQEP